MIKYFNSEALGLKCKLDTITGIVYVNEQDAMYSDTKFVEYSRSELDVLEKAGGGIDQNIHNLKNMFGGTIIEKPSLKELTMSDKFRR